MILAKLDRTSYTRHNTDFEPRKCGRMSTTRLEKLIEKRKQIDAQIQKASAIERTKKRKADTRRKIIVGALAIENMEMHPNGSFTRELQRVLNEHVARPKDRELIGLPPIRAAEDFSKTG